MTSRSRTGAFILLLALPLALIPWTAQAMPALPSIYKLNGLAFVQETNEQVFSLPAVHEGTLTACAEQPAGVKPVDGGEMIRVTIRGGLKPRGASFQFKANIHGKGPCLLLDGRILPPLPAWSYNEKSSPERLLQARNHLSWDPARPLDLELRIRWHEKRPPDQLQLQAHGAHIRGRWLPDSKRSCGSSGECSFLATYILSAQAPAPPEWNWYKELRQLKLRVIPLVKLPRGFMVVRKQKRVMTRDIFKFKAQVPYDPTIYRLYANAQAVNQADPPMGGSSLATRVAPIQTRAKDDQKKFILSSRGSGRALELVVAQMPPVPPTFTTFTGQTFTFKNVALAKNERELVYSTNARGAPSFKLPTGYKFCEQVSGFDNQYLDIRLGKTALNSHTIYLKSNSPPGLRLKLLLDKNTSGCAATTRKPFFLVTRPAIFVSGMITNGGTASANIALDWSSKTPSKMKVWIHSKELTGSKNLQESTALVIDGNGDAGAKWDCNGKTSFCTYTVTLPHGQSWGAPLHAKVKLVPRGIDWAARGELRDPATGDRFKADDDFILTVETWMRSPTLPRAHFRWDPKVSSVPVGARVDKTWGLDWDEARLFNRAWKPCHKKTAGTVQRGRIEILAPTNSDNFASLRLTGRAPLRSHLGGGLGVTCDAIYKIPMAAIDSAGAWTFIAKETFTLEPGSCTYTLRQLTQVFEGMNDAKVYFSVEGVSDAGSPCDDRQWRVEVKNHPDKVSKWAEVESPNKKGDLVAMTFQKTPPASKIPHKSYPLVITTLGGSAVAIAPGSAELTVDRLEGFDAPLLLANLGTKHQKDMVDITSAAALAQDRDNYFVFDRLTDLDRWKITLESAMFKPCANDEEGESEEKEAPHGTGPEELELKATIVSGTMKGYCLEAPSKTSRNPRLKARHLPPAKEIFTSSANQGTRAQLKSSMVNAGWRYVEPAFKASPYNLALDLREHLGLMCGKTLVLDTHPLRPVRRSGMKECKLVIRRNPQAAMTKESLDKESGTPEQTRRWEKFIIGKGTQNLTFTVATTKQKSVKNFNTPTLRVDPYNKSWEKSQDGLYVAEAGLVIPLDLTQAALAGLDALETLTITVTHTAPKTDYVIDVNRSVPARSFTARLVKAPFLSAWDDDKGIGFRTYATLPLGLTLMRSPSTGRDATKSEQVRAVEEASFAVGVVGALELWNYHKNEPVVPILNPMVQLGVLTSAPTDFSIWDGFSFVAGFAFRSPVTTTTDTVVETELSFNIWYELLVAPKGTDVTGHWFVHHGVLFGFSAEIGTLFE